MSSETKGFVVFIMVKKWNIFFIAGSQALTLMNTRVINFNFRLVNDDQVFYMIMDIVLNL